MDYLSPDKLSGRSGWARKGWRATQAEFPPAFCEERTFLLPIPPSRGHENPSP